MAETRIQAPRITRPVLRGLETATVDVLEPYGTVDGVRLSGVETAACDLTETVLTSCELTDVTAQVVDAAGARFADVVITHLRAPRFSAPRASLVDVTIGSSRLGALELIDATIRAVIVEDAKLGLINLSGSRIRDLVFRDCDIDELDLGTATATRVAFENCSLGMLDVNRATLSYVDLRGVAIRGIRNLDALRGTVIDEEQVSVLAPAFAAHLGITVA